MIIQTKQTADTICMKHVRTFIGIICEVVFEKRRPLIIYLHHSVVQQPSALQP